MVLNINNNEVVKFTVILEKLRTSALPSAIRGTLNDAAFDVKQKTMPVQARAEFINRSPNFFKANSKVDMAAGFNVNSMKATVGFFSNNLKGQNNFAVKDLEDQEYSGSIDKKSFIPLDPARKSGYTSLVKPANRLTAIKNIVVARNMGAGTKKQQFIKAIYKAGAGGYVLGSNVKGEEILWRVDSIDPNPDVKRFSLTPLYDFQKSRKVKVGETMFMRTASLNSADKLNKFYIAQAEFQVKRYAK